MSELSIAPKIESEKEIHVGRIYPNVDADYIWILTKHIGVKKSKVMGSMVKPSSEIDGGLTAEYILQQLNQNQCFDFAYKPSYNDILTIRPNNLNFLFNYITLKFKDGEWKNGFVNNFTDITKFVDRGELLVVPPPPGYKSENPVIEKRKNPILNKLRTLVRGIFQR